ncbi:MAG: hypothetical protein M1817_000485 [Caeruleum heppii]|nr:MAG: hypothetical protein M1817_000485 [Caeruleum heppii]
MDDLADLDWNATPASSAVKPPPMGSSAFYPPIRPTPSPHLSGHATPLSNQASGKANKYPLDQKPSSRSSTPGNDSFSNLVSFNSTKSSNNLTLQERQKLLLNEKSKQEAERRRKYEAQYAAQDHKLWESLGATAQATSVDLRKDGSGKDTAHGPQPGDAAEGDDDLFAAFNAEAKVDSSSHFPPPSQNSSAVAATASTDDPLQSTAGDPSHSAHQSAPQAASSISHDVDDDPFGLAQLGSRQIPSSRPDAGADEEDDILGLLGKPVSERPNTVRDRTAHSAALPIESADSAQDASERAVSEIVEMGFPPDEAREALSRTENGTDVQAATGWLLDEAHRKAKVKKGFNESERNRRNERPGRSTDATGHREEPTEVPNATPAWMRSKDRGGADQRRRDDQSPGKGDKDITKIASEVGNNLFRSANSLWASGRKKVQKAVTELQEDAEPSQPKSLVNIKVGDPKAAVTDAEKALDVIGPSRGEGETMALDGNDGEKKMDEYFGKALMRKAEALEQMEKWSEAAGAWKAAVETGVGGATSIQGRDRCEKVAGTGKQASDSTMSIRPSTTQALPRRAPPRAQAKPAMKGPSAALSEAVSKLHEADAAHEREEAEKSALADGVNAKIAAWKGEKQDNLRALLCSLDTVLWPEAGWKKVGMHDLVMANKVKVNYMKGIAKVHPDKIPTTATTEQRMISGSVFYTLNQAWVKFKQENGL